MKFIAITDLHAPTPDCAEYARLNRLVAQIVREHKDAEAVLILGDFIDAGHRLGYWHVLRALYPLREAGLHILCVPGNHDVSLGPIGTFYDSDARQAWCEFDGLLTSIENRSFPYVTDHGDQVRLIGLDSTLGCDEIVSLGCIGADQLALLDGYLDTDRTCIVYTHHHYVQQEPWLALEDWKELFGVLDGRCAAALCGHKHEQWVWRRPGEIDWIISLGKSTKPGVRFLELRVEDGEVHPPIWREII